ncbi:response regulator [Halopseudomonas pachastrellae]|uniref:response regulator n=1 Tax=Halopseudomonas pachastrellae TaxID=254161 RepID=UPI003D7DC5A2
MSHKSVLVVDDEADILLELDEFLTTMGVRCVCASSVAEAMQCLQQNADICLIITDLRMPEQSGLRLIQMLKDGRAEQPLPIIVTSGHADMADVITLFRSGVVDFLPKPIYFDHLIELLERFVPGYSSALPTS